MAQSRRIDPAQVYMAHAAEARAAQAAAVTDAARTHFDHAASAHETAARIQARIPQLQRTAAMLAAAAETSRVGRHGMFRLRANLDAAMFNDARLDETAAAARISADHAERHHLRGLEHAATAREHEMRALDGTEPEEGEDRVAHATRIATDVAAKRVVVEARDRDRAAAKLADAPPLSEAPGDPDIKRGATRAPAAKSE